MKSLCWNAVVTRPGIAGKVKALSLSSVLKAARSLGPRMTVAQVAEALGEQETAQTVVRPALEAIAAKGFLRSVEEEFLVCE